HLGPLGTGAYPIPWNGTAAGTQLYGQGPTAMVLFNSSGFPVMENDALVTGLLLAILCSLLVAITVRAVGDGSLGFSRRLSLIALIAIAVTAYGDLGQPIFNHAPWGYYVYLWV